MILLHADIDFLFVFACAFCAVFSMVLRRFLYESLRASNLTLPSVFFYSFVVLTCIPSLICVGTFNSSMRSIYILAIHSVLLTFPIGILMANFLFVNVSHRVRVYGKSSVQVTAGDLRFFPAFIFSLIVSIIGVGSYFIFSRNIPILSIIFEHGSRYDELDLRLAIYELPLVVQLYFALTYRCILPICVLYAFFVSRVRHSWKGVFWFLLIINLFVCSFTLERGPAVGLMVMMGFASMVAGGWPILSWRRVLVIVVMLSVALLVGGILTIYQTGKERSLAALLDGCQHMLVERIFYDNSKMASLTFDTFSTESSLLHGKHWRILSILPGWEYTKLEDTSTLDGLHYLPVGFVADLWRNWGWSAVLIGGVLYGFMLQFIQLSLFKHKTAIAAIFQVIIMLNALFPIIGLALGAVTTAIFVLCGIVGYIAIRCSENMNNANRRLKYTRADISVK